MRPATIASIVSIALIAVVGCHSKSESAKRPDSTSAIDVPIPAPALSRFDVPLRYDFTPVLAIVERVVPKKFGSLDSVRQVGEDDHKHYAFEATRGPFTATAHGSEVHLQSTLSYSARGYYKPLIGPTIGAGCGKEGDRPSIVVELVTPITIDHNWHLKSAVQLARLTPASDSGKDRCKVSILHFDVTDRVVDAAKTGLTAHLKDIDAKIAGIDLTQRAQGWWALLNAPIHLTDSVWLVLQPEQLRVGRVTGDGHVLTVRAGLDAHPKIVTGAEPNLAPPPLPPVGRDTAATGFSILIEGYVDYETASRTMSAALAGKTVTQANRSVTVQSVVASPDSGGRMAIAVTFTGDASGTLRFDGTPTYQPGRRVIVVPDLTYALNTNDRLIRTYAWLRSDALQELFRDKALVPVAPVLEQGKALLLAGLNRTIGGVMTLSATVDSVAVRNLYVTRQGLLVRAAASGTARVSVREQPRGRQ